MSKGGRSFRQRDLTRAIKGAEAAGKVVTAASITATGEIKVSFDKVSEPQVGRCSSLGFSNSE